MKLAFFDDFKLGVVVGDNVVDVSAVVKDIPRVHPHDIMSGLITRFDEYRKRLDEAAARGPGIPVGKVKFRPPLPRPVNIDCMAVNYMEDGTRKVTPEISAFHKSPSAIIGDGDTMVLPDDPAHIFEGEAEVAVVIGKRATRVSEADAINHVFGYCNFIDGSARGLPPQFAMFHRMKSRDTFGPIGPWLVTADEFTNPQNRQIRLWNNGKLMQNFNTSDMAHAIPKCVAFVSAQHTLEPGDLIATGTNHRGLNAFMDGDKIELETDGLGRLTIHIRDDLKRVWARDTRLEHAEKKLEGQHTPQISGKYAPAKK